MNPAKVRWTIEPGRWRCTCGTEIRLAVRGEITRIAGYHRTAGRSDCATMEMQAGWMRTARVCAEARVPFSEGALPRKLAPVFSAILAANVRREATKVAA